MNNVGAAIPAAKPVKPVKSSLAKRTLHKFLSNRLAIVGMVIVSALVLISVLAPVLTPYSPTVVDPANRFLPPSSEHWLGTDQLGRDLVSRLMYGGRVSIFVGLVSALSAAAVGCVLGCISGFFGGKVDSVILYISEIFMVFPQILLVLILVGFVGQGLENLIIIFTITGWASVHRVVRSRILSLKEETFVESCRANGISGGSIMFRHLLPNTTGPIIVNITLATAGFLLQESALSFLNMGVPTDIPTWGNIINAARSLTIIQNYPVMWIAPGICICLFVLGINFFGDGLRDALDPT